MAKGGGIAHVVAANMGYGHERPAHVMRRFAVGGEVVIANSYEGIPHADRRVWETTRQWYERISRFKKTPVLGRTVFAVMDELQRIPDFYPHRDLSAPSLQLRTTYHQIRRQNHMRHLIEMLGKRPKPLLCTFSPPAFAAEEFRYPGEIFCLATDADISRAWAPLEPKKTRIRYLAPNGRVKERLEQYGIPSKNIELTGFPLPTELIGGEESTVALKHLRRRICNLDPNGIFVGHTGIALTSYLGPQYCASIRRGKPTPITLTFAVGGAGAQREIGVDILRSLAGDIRRGNIQYTMVAGTRKEVADYFEEAIRRAGLTSMRKRGGVDVLFSSNRRTYFDTFTTRIGETDILWTKPSELSFYTGLGLPIIMSPPVGSQEDFNHKWLEQIGGGIDQLDARYTHEWLWDWIESGSFARMAWNGFIEAPTHGAYRIADILLGRPNSIHALPLVV